MRTILVVDNETPILNMLSSTLRGAGYQVLAASGGQEAIASAARHNGGIDLLITDIVMPGMGGAELYAWLKSERPELRVLFISGYMSREPLKAGFLKKPFDPGTLLQKVEELLPRTESGEASGGGSGR
jgi:CheY-like chemotaxis protein